jgi:hypothetical protein
MPRKTKPSFDLPPASKPIDTQWVYRSDAAATAPAVVGPAVAAPVVAPAVAPSPARVAGLESAIAWLSKPFEVAVLMALVPCVGARRRPPAAPKSS